MKYPEIICIKCKEKRGNWCKKFNMSLYLALQNGCDRGLNMTEKNNKKGSE